MRGPAQLASYVAVGMILTGFMIIGLAWNGAASLDRLPSQFPYLLSGGMGGLGLIVAGMAIMYVQTTRTLTAERSRRYSRVNAEMAQVLDLVGDGEFVGALQGALGPASNNGTSARQGALVVAGRGSFHEPDCHLVSSRDDLPHMPRERAEEDGLSACRVCHP